MSTNSTIFKQGEDKPLITGPAGQLEVLTSQPEQANTDYIAICCHPHPLHEGSMHNKVVTTMAKACSNLAIPSVRFNFRGVGQSEGDYGETIGELEDLQTVVAWVRELGFKGQFILMGFSFGAYIVAKLASTMKPAYLLSVAPPVHHFEFAPLGRIACPWTVIQGDADEVVPPSEVFAWLDTLKPQPNVICMPDVGHFFHGRLVELRQYIEADLAKHL